MVQILAIFDVIFHNSAAKPNLDKRLKTGRLNLARYLAGNQVTTKYQAKSKHPVFERVSKFGLAAEL